MNPLFKDLARAVALGESETAQQLDGQLNDDDRSTYQGYLTAVFAVMLGVRFEEDASRAEIDRFVDQVRQGYPANAVKPLALEATIRALVADEGELIEEVSTADQIQAEMLAIRAITATVPKVSDNLEACLSDAEALLNAELD